MSHPAPEDEQAVLDGEAALWVSVLRLALADAAAPRGPEGDAKWHRQGDRYRDEARAWLTSGRAERVVALIGLDVDLWRANLAVWVAAGWPRMPTISGTRGTSRKTQYVSSGKGLRNDPLDMRSAPVHTHAP